MSKRREARERLRRRRELAKSRKLQAKTEPFSATKASEPRDKLNAAAVTNKKEVARERQAEIDALELEVAELGRLSAPSQETTAEIERIRRAVEELKRDFYTHLGA